MYVTIRKYAGKSGLMDRLAPQVRDGLVPLLRQAPGFKGYCAFASEDGMAVGMNIFADKAAADAAKDPIREWVASTLGDLLPDPPEAVSGQVLLHALVHEQEQRGGPEQALYVVIRQYDGVQAIERMMALGQEQVVPLLRQAPGFRGLYAFGSDQDRDRVVSVTMFESREQAMRAHEQVLAIMREKGREVAPDPPQVTAGRTFVLATA